MHRQTSFFFSLIIAVAITALVAAQAGAASVESFSPQGEQLDIRQAQARFSAPMTALGQSDAPAPFNIDCGIAGNGYWTDERTWVYDLSTPIAGVTCRFQLKPELTTLAGEKVVADADYLFSVIGPRILASLPQPGATLDEDQIFVLRLNGAARADSLATYARCEAQGIHEQIPIQRLSGAERARKTCSMSWAATGTKNKRKPTRNWKCCAASAPCPPMPKSRWSGAPASQCRPDKATHRISAWSSACATISSRGCAAKEKTPRRAVCR